MSAEACKIIIDGSAATTGTQSCLRANTVRLEAAGHELPEDLVRKFVRRTEKLGEVSAEMILYIEQQMGT